MIDVIIERYENLTGKKAELITDRWLLSEDNYEQRRITGHIW